MNVLSYMNWNFLISLSWVRLPRKKANSSRKDEPTYNDEAVQNTPLNLSKRYTCGKSTLRELSLIMTGEGAEA